MKKSKNLKIVLSIIIFILSLIFLFLAIMKVRKIEPNLEVGQFKNVSIKDALAQSYVVSKKPSLKEDDKIIGSKKAPVKIFVYEDNSSVYSAELADTLDKIYSEMPTKVAIIIRSFIPKNSLVAKESSLAIECAGKEKWISMRALLFAKTKNESLNLSEIDNYAEQIGLNKESFLTCLTNEKKSSKIEKLSEEASSYNILGAPTIFIDEEMILGARPYEDYIDSNGDKIEGLKLMIEKKVK